MAEADNEDFLSRWSRRKAQARRGDDVPEPAEPKSTVPAVTRLDADVAEPAQVVPGHEYLPGAAAMPATPSADETVARNAGEPLTLADVAKLTHDSDFSRFVAGGVDPDVKNAALKKLFSDPHFNSMDGLDVYIDDYGVPSPLPQHLLMKMAQAKFLGLVKDQADAALARVPDLLASETGSAAPTQTSRSGPIADSTAPHEDADLQLQPDDDARRSGAAPGVDDDAGREH